MDSIPHFLCAIDVVCCCCFSYCCGTYSFRLFDVKWNKNQLYKLIRSRFTISIAELHLHYTFIHNVFACWLNAMSENGSQFHMGKNTHSNKFNRFFEKNKANKMPDEWQNFWTCSMHCIRMSIKHTNIYTQTHTSFCQ